MIRIIFLSLFFISCNMLHAQYNRGDFNHIGITGGVTMPNWHSKHLKVDADNGWMAGLSVRGNYYNDFSMVYGMHFMQHAYKLDVVEGFSTQEVELKHMAAQIYLLLSYKIAGSFVTLDAGPVAQFNGKLDGTLSDSMRLSEQPSWSAKDFSKLNTFSAAGHIGITAGFENIRLNVSYQHGLTNLISKPKEGNEKLKATSSLVFAGIIFYL